MHLKSYIILHDIMSDVILKPKDNLIDSIR